MCTHSLGHHQPEAVGGVHLSSGSERAVARCGVDRDQADATLSRVARTPRTIDFPRCASLDGCPRHSLVEVQEEGGGA